MRDPFSHNGHVLNNVTCKQTFTCRVGTSLKPSCFVVPTRLNHDSDISLCLGDYVY